MEDPARIRHDAAPDESYIIFSSDRAGPRGAGDLYVSFNESGRWTAPQNLEEIVNTSEYEYTALDSVSRRMPARV